MIYREFIAHIQAGVCNPASPDIPGSRDWLMIPTMGDFPNDAYECDSTEQSVSELAAINYNLVFLEYCLT